MQGPTRMNLRHPAGRIMSLQVQKRAHMVPQALIAGSKAGAIA